MPLLTVLLSLPTALAWPLESSWATVERSGAPLTDDAGDVISTIDADYLDLVGTSAAPVALWYADADAVYLRMRVSESPWLAEAGAILNQGTWTFAIESDGDQDTLDSAISFSGSAIGANSVLLYRNNGGETGAGAPLSLVYTYSTNPVDDGTARLAETTSAINGGVDWTIDLVIDRDTLYTQLGIGPTTGIKLALLTSTGRQSAIHDADLAGPADMDSLRRGWSDTLFIDGDADDLTDPEELLYGTSIVDADSDDDGLLDGREVLINTDALVCDSDGDSLPDGLERGVAEPDAATDLSAGCFVADLEPTNKTDASQRDTDQGGIEDGDEDWNTDGAVGYWEIDPLDPADDVDTDVDGIPDAIEAKCQLDRGALDDGTNGGDSDGDTLSDLFEWSQRGLRDADGDGTPNFCDRDSDDDGIPDWDETEADSDGDGTPDYADTDSDNNGVLDEDEGSEADNDSDGTPDFQDTDDENGPTGDADGDGLRNDEEGDCGSDPLDPDTDGDGIGDEQEGPCTEDSDCDGVPNVLDATDDSLCDQRDNDEGQNPLTGDTFTGGNFTGGACNSGAGAASLAPALLALLSLLRRRGGLALLLGLPSTAMAAEGGQALNAQRFRPSLTAERFTVLNDTTLGQPLDASAGLWLNYAHDPFVYRYSDPTKDDFQILGNVVTADMIGWINLPYVRLGADLPLHLVSTGYGVEGFRLIGDTRLMAAGEIIHRGDEGLGVSALGFVDIPTGNESTWLGEGRAVVGAQGAASYGLGPVLGVANLGLRSGTGQLFPDDLRIGPRLDWGLGGSYALSPALSAALELNGELILGGGTIGARPAEVMASGRYRVLPNLLVSGGLGGGITRGVGAPNVRVAAGVAWVPALREDVPPPSAPDRDGDGVEDAVDLCPDQPEDLNGVDDADGCPEGDLTPTRVRVMDARGNYVSPARLELVSGPATGSFALSDGELVRSMEPGTYKVSATADGYTSATEELNIPKARTHEHTIRLDKVVAPASVAVMVRDNQGRPLNATVRILGPNGQKVPGSDDGLTELSLPPGAYGLLISADGYRSLEKAITVEEGGSASLDVQLEAAKVVVQQDQVVILDKVFFELDSAVIRTESFSLLDEVAETLIAHPEITLVEVQGHTDDQGRDAYNQELSDKRARAVMDYLVRSGVEASRLTSKGYGESQPLVAGTTEDARAANRRVEFHIRKRSTTR